MKLDPDFFAEIMRIINGEIVPPIEAAKNAERLESNEEFFAWLLLRQRLGKEEAELANRIVAIARCMVVKAETRRQKSEFPIEQRQAHYQLECALMEMLKADHEASEVGECVRRALADFNLSQTAFLDNFTTGLGRPYTVFLRKN